MEDQQRHRGRGLSNPTPRSRNHGNGGSAPPTPSLTIDMQSPALHLNGSRSAGPSTPLGRSNSSGNLPVPPNNTRPALQTTGNNGTGSRSDLSTVAPSATSSSASGSTSRGGASKRAVQLPAVPETKNRRRAASSAATRAAEPAAPPPFTLGKPRELQLRNARHGLSELASFPQEIYRRQPMPTMYQDKPVCPLHPHWSLSTGWGSIPTNGYRSHTATLVDNTIWYFGGFAPADISDLVKVATTRPGKTFRNVRCFDTESQCWSYPEMQGEQPPNLRSHTATLLDDSKIIVYGGSGEDNVYLADIWCLDTKLRHWSNLTPKLKPSSPQPAPRRSHSAVIYKKKMYMFGGGSGTSALDDCWMLDLSNLAELMWSEVKTNNPRPSSRGYHSANLVNQGMVIFGGTGGSQAKDDIWLLDLDTHEWREIVVAGEKRVSLYGHSSTLIGNYLFVFGGMNNQKTKQLLYTQELEVFNLLYREWTEFTSPDCFFRLTGSIKPSGRAFHTAILNDSRLWVFGGFNGDDMFFDQYILDLGALAYIPNVTNWDISDIFADTDEEA